MLGSVKNALSATPVSFSKKKNYELHETLGEGTFGQVVVRTVILDVFMHGMLTLGPLARYLVRASRTNLHSRTWCSCRWPTTTTTYRNSFDVAFSILCFLPTQTSCALPQVIWLFHKRPAHEGSCAEDDTQEESERQRSERLG